MMPNGMSRLASLASSDAVDTASKPMYAKKMIAAALPMPLNPLGAKPPCTVQFSGLT